MRKINEIIVHCSGTLAMPSIGLHQIRSYHLGLGWQDVGYHFIIKTDGTIEVGRPIYIAGAHCRNHNRNSIGICYVGGLDSKLKPCDTRTPEQITALRNLIIRLCRQYPIIRVSGHNEYQVSKKCPCFDAHKLYQRYVKTKDIFINPDNKTKNEKGD